MLTRQVEQLKNQRQSFDKEIEVGEFEELVDIERHKKIFDKLESESAADYVRFISHSYMLEVRQLPDLDSKLDGVYG